MCEIGEEEEAQRKAYQRLTLSVVPGLYRQVVEEDSSLLKSAWESLWQSRGVTKQVFKLRPLSPFRPLFQLKGWDSHVFGCDLICLRMYI